MLLTYSRKLSSAYANLTVHLRLEIEAKALICKCFRDIKTLTYTSYALFGYAPEIFFPCVGCGTHRCVHILVTLSFRGYRYLSPLIQGCPLALKRVCLKGLLRALLRAGQKTKACIAASL